tara:strand:+ start:383 stop:1315 length:933 start_codon:yes stop_codon:yes gene_type:complete
MYAIIGANGFIGRHLCNLLDQKKVKYKAFSRSKIEGFESIGDINECTNWDKSLKDVHTVFHLASKAHVFNISNNDFSESLNKDIKGTQRLALEASKLGVKKLIYLSSVKVCGEETSDLNLFSNKSPMNPKNLYSITKAKTEIVLKEVSNKTGLEIVIIRPPLVYGPGVKANFLSLLNLANNNIPLPFANINNKRSIIFVGNLVDFIFECSQQNKAIGKTFLISDPNPRSTSELLINIKVALKKKLILFKFPKVILFIILFIIGKIDIYKKLFYSLEIDPKESYKFINWTPKISYEDSLKITANWYKFNNK